MWRLGTNAGVRRDLSSAHSSHDAELYRLLRLWMVNRGVWEAMEWAGPAISIAASDEHVEQYIETLGGLVRELTT